MKIPRHTQGRTNIGMLESSRNALYSPKEAAAAAGAGWQTVSDIANIGAETLSAYDKAKQATQIADDKLLLSHMETQTKIDETAFLTKAEEESMSTEDIEAGLNEIYTRQEDYLEQLQHPQSRANVEKSLRLGIELKKAEGAQKVLEIGTKRTIKENQSQWDAATLNKDLPALQILMDNMETSIYGEPEMKLWQAKFDKVKEQVKLDTFMEEAVAIGQVALTDSEEAWKQVKGILEGTHLPEKDRSKLASMAVAEINKSNGIRAQEKSEEDDRLQKVTNTDLLEIGTGESDLATPSIFEKYEAGGYGEVGTNASFNRFTKVLNAHIKKLESTQEGLVFAANLESGMAMAGNQKDRESLEAHIEGLIKPGMSNEEMLGIELRNIEKAGFLTQTKYLELNAGTRSSADMRRGFPIFKALTSGDRKYDLGLTEDQYSDYLYIDAMTEFATTQEEINTVLETWEQSRAAARKQGSALKDVWKEEIYAGKTGQALMTKAFDNAIEEGQFDDGWWDAEDSNRNLLVKQQLRNKFEFIAKKQLELGATPDMAAQAATKFIEQQGRITSINGYEEIQMNLPDGTEDIDMEHMKDKAIGNQFSGLRGGITEVDGEGVRVNHYSTAGMTEGITPEGLDESKIRLYVPTDKRASRDANGDVVFEVYYDGNPLNAETEKGLQPVKFSFSQDEFVSKEAKESKKKNYAAISDKAREKYNKLIAEKESDSLNIYRTANLDQQIKDAKNFLEKTEKDYWKYHTKDNN